MARKIFRPVFPENLTRNVLFYTLWKKVDSKSNSLLEYFNQATKNHKCLQNCADFQQKIRAQNAMLKYRVNILACQNFILIHTVNCFMEVCTVVVNREIGYLTDSKKVTIITIPWPMEKIYGNFFWKYSKNRPPRASKIQAICPAKIWLYSLIILWQPVFYKILFL